MGIKGLLRSEDSFQREWWDKTVKYADRVNRFVKRGLENGWDNAGTEPKDPGRDHLAKAALKAVRKANRLGKVDELRERWPPAHEPFFGILDSVGRSIPFVTMLDDGTILARIGAPYEHGYLAYITDKEVKPVPGVQFVGRSACRRFFAVANSNGVEVLEGWNGPVICHCPWPSGTEGAPEGAELEPFDQPPRPTRMIPFANGLRVLLVAAEGIFVLSPSGARRLLPTTEDMAEHFEWLAKENPGDRLELELSMEHGTISPDGRWIAVGAQDSNHLVFNQDLELVADIGPMSSYPHHAAFSPDSEFCIFNSCHFYNGITIGCCTELFGTLKTEPYEEDERTPTMEDCSRVYAAVARGEQFIIGDANGYLRAFDRSGRYLWQHYIGSRIWRMN